MSRGGRRPGAGRPVLLSIGRQIQVFMEFGRMLQANPKLKGGVAHRLLAAKYGVGPRTIRDAIAHWEAVAACTDPDLVPPVAGTDPESDRIIEWQRRVTDDPELRPALPPTTQAERTSRIARLKALAWKLGGTRHHPLVTDAPTLLKRIRKRQNRAD